MTIVQGGQTLLKQGKQQGTEVSRDRSCRLFTPLGLELLQTLQPEYKGFTNSQHMNSKCSQFEVLFAHNLAASVPTLLFFFIASQLYC